MNIVFINLLIVCMGYLCEGESATLNQQQELVDIHNHFRRLLATGKIRGQPAAADMSEMKWSSISAAKAQESAGKCVFQHDSYEFRSYADFEYVGQNIAMFSEKNISKGIQMWFDEVTYFNYRRNSCSGMCGHYTQVAWANSKELGCGIAQCPYGSFDMTFLICNYAPAGNFNSELPYQEGPACSKCGENLICVDGLCR